MFGRMRISAKDWTNVGRGNDRFRFCSQSVSGSTRRESLNGSGRFRYSAFLGVMVLDNDGTPYFRSGRAGGVVRPTSPPFFPEMLSWRSDEFEKRTGQELIRCHDVCTLAAVFCFVRLEL